MSLRLSMSSLHRALGVSLASLLLAPPGLGATDPAQQHGCYMTCVALPSKTCVLQDGSNVGRDLRAFDNCHPLKVKAGPVKLSYRHKGQWFSPPALLKDDTEIDALFKEFPPDECSIPQPACLQRRQANKVAAVGGHGIDGLVSKPAGIGEPCALGLPCGLVLPPVANWRFQLEDRSLQGQWIVSIVRGEPPAGVPKEFALAVEGGAVSADGTRFAPGTTYTYRLIDKAGAQRASGELSIVGRSMQDTLGRMAAKRVAAGMPESAAWIDALSAGELDWDAYQATLVGR